MREHDEEDDPPRRSDRRRRDRDDDDFERDEDGPRRRSERRRRDRDEDDELESERDDRSRPWERRRRDRDEDDDYEEEEDDRPRRRRRRRIDYGPGDPAMELLVPQNTSALSIVAGYVGLISVLCIPAPLAIILGILALRQFNKNPELHGRYRAIFALVMGVICSLPLPFALYALIQNK